MSESLESALGTLTAKLGSEAFSTSTFLDNTRVHVVPDRLLDVLRVLKDECGFAMLTELGGADYQGYPGKNGSGSRFEVHYVLRDLDANRRIVVKTGLDEPHLELPSVVAMWKGADWMEREVYDMYGISFLNHPDLRRILLPEEFTAFPLRKDYPLRGRGERHNFPRLTRSES